MAIVPTPPPPYAFSLPLCSRLPLRRIHSMSPRVRLHNSHRRHGCNPLPPPSALAILRSFTIVDGLNSVTILTPQQSLRSLAPRAAAAPLAVMTVRRLMHRGLEGGGVLVGAEEGRPRVTNLPEEESPSAAIATTRRGVRRLAAQRGARSTTAPPGKALAVEYMGDDLT